MQDDKGADMLNIPVLLARDMAWLQVQQFLQGLPNPPGQIRENDVPRRFTMAELQRALKGE